MRASGGVLAPGATATVAVTFGHTTDVEREAVIAVEYIDAERGFDDPTVATGGSLSARGAAPAPAAAGKKGEPAPVAQPVAALPKVTDTLPWHMHAVLYALNELCPT